MKGTTTILVSLSIIIIFSIFFVNAQLPSPNRQVGYPVGNPAAPVVLEMFADLQCIYCGGAFPTISQVVNYFGQDKLYFVLHIFPLWLHRQAYDAAKALAAINQLQPTQTITAAAYFFKNQAQFSNAQFVNQTEQQLIDLFTQYAVDLGFDKNDFLNAYESESVATYVSYDIHLAISRQVPGTPVFWVNGFVNSTLGDSTTYDEWVSYIGGLIANN